MAPTAVSPGGVVVFAMRSEVSHSKQLKVLLCD
jgi:hypothetical protein